VRVHRKGGTERTVFLSAGHGLAGLACIFVPILLNPLWCADNTLFDVERPGALPVLERRQSYVETIEEAVNRVRPFKQRRRGLNAGELMVSLAETVMAGGDHLVNLDQLRGDLAAAELRAVAAAPAPTTAGQALKRFGAVSPSTRASRVAASRSESNPAGTSPLLVPAVTNPGAPKLPDAASGGAFPDVETGKGHRVVAGRDVSTSEPSASEAPDSP
jgi:hypothetical protein